MLSQVFSRPHILLGLHTTLAVAGTAVGVNPSSIPNGASAAIIGNVTADANWSYDVDPTGTTGIPLPLDNSIVLEDIDDFSKLRFIQQSGATTITFVWASGVSSRKL